MPLHDPAHAFVPYPDVPVPHAGHGPLCGLSFGVKDLFDVAGYPTGGGNPLMLAMSGVKTHTAPTVQRLLDAGARFVGKTVTDELAFSMNGNNAHFGAPLNGAAPDRISGGSSSGSASAVSSKLCDLPWAPTPAARCGHPPAIAASTASGPRTGASAWKARSTSRPAWTPAASLHAMRSPSNAWPRC